MAFTGEIFDIIRAGINSISIHTANVPMFNNMIETRLRFTGTNFK
jgi:hypothetical protein